MQISNQINFELDNNTQMQDLLEDHHFKKNAQLQIGTSDPEALLNRKKSTLQTLKG
jgi:hypothetical protein